MSKEMIKLIVTTPDESIVDVYGIVAKPEKEITYCTQKVEIIIEGLEVVNSALAHTPFEINSKLTSEEENQVPFRIRLNNRPFDLRRDVNQAIFKISSGVCQLYR